MSTLKGRNLSKKRNLLKQFLGSYSMRPGADERPARRRRYVLEDWLKTTKMNAGDTDYGPCLEALDRYEELVLCGGIYYAEGEPAGFALGKNWTPRPSYCTLPRHGRNSRDLSICLQQFRRDPSPRYRYLNLEQDLDKENLRVFKAPICRCDAEKGAVSVKGQWKRRAGSWSVRAFMKKVGLIYSDVFLRHEPPAWHPDLRTG